MNGQQRAALDVSTRGNAQIWSLTTGEKRNRSLRFGTRLPMTSLREGRTPLTKFR